MFEKRDPCLRLRPPAARLSVVAGLLVLAAAPVLAQTPASAPTAPSNDVCLACHDDKDAKRGNGTSVFVASAVFAASVHGQGGMSCVDCHADLATAETPHGEKLQPASCGTCHDQAVAQYVAGVHSEARRTANNGLAATCRDCHGAHEIRKSDDPESSTSHFNLPKTCARCHGDEDVIKKGKIAIGNVATLYDDSIHGRALTRAGLLVAPNCADCHGAHEIRRKGDKGSRVFRAAIPATCGRCHEGIDRAFENSVHGAQLRLGNVVAATCTDCHTAHGITRAATESWQLQVIRECGRCHRESVRTYRDTYHGQVTSLGFVRVAKCADCHSAHDIQPKSDPRSMVSEARVVSTCQRCHPGATQSFAAYDPHADHENPERNPTLFYASRFMTGLLTGVFGFFSLHTALWLSRTVRPGRAARAAHGSATPAEPASPTTESTSDASDPGE